MNISKIKLIQTHVGVTPDGIIGDKTVDAIFGTFGLTEQPAQPPKLRIAIDPGHGMSNRKPGVYDPGCMDDGFAEADIVMQWASSLYIALEALNIETWMTRKTDSDPCPVSTRASRAVTAGCTHLISIHVNDADSPEANGTEVLYYKFYKLADRVLPALIAGLNLRDRGTQKRPDLAVLKFPGPCCLIELGFIQSVADRAAFLDPVKRKQTCELIAKTFQP